MAKSAPNLIRDASYGELIQDPMYLNVAQKVTINGASNRNSTDFTSVIIELTPTIDCFVELGDDTVVAVSGESHFITANSTRRINTKDDVRIAVQNLTSGEAGSLYISEMV